MKICNSCGNKNGDNAKFCIECGEKLQESPKFCPECGTELVNQPKFCPECGTKINNVVSNCKSPTMETKNSTSYSLGVYNAIVPGLTNYGGEVELCDAIKFGYLDKVKSLLNEGENLEELSSYDLACVHNGEMLNFIIKHGNFDFSDANFTTDILSSLENMYSCSLSNYMEDPNHKDFLENGDIFNSVQDIHNKYLGILKVLVDNGADVNSYTVGWTILESACFSKMDELICFLVEYCNADVNLDYSGDSSPLAMATSAVTGPLKNDQIAVKTMRLLIKHGADVNFHSGESTPLSNVMIDKNFELMEILYENGAVVTDYVKKLLDIYEGEERKKVKKILGFEVESVNTSSNDEYSTEYIGNELIEDDESFFAQTPSFSITEKKDKIHKMVLNYAEQIGEKCIDWKVRNYESFPADKKELLLKIDCNFNYEDFATMFSIPNPLKLQRSAKFDYGIIFTIFGFYITTIDSLNSFTFVKYSEIVSCEVIKNEHIKIYISTKLKTMFGLSENFIECGNYLARPLSELLTELKKLDSEFSTDYLTSITTARADGLKTSRDRKYFMKGQINGYTRCSRQYEEKLRRQADLFLKTTNKWKKERSEYDALLDEYDATIVELEEKLSQVESPEYRRRLNNVVNYRDQLASLSY